MKKMKLVAKTQEGKEFLHSKQDAFFASTNAQKIVDILNKNKYKLEAGEKWHVYAYDFTQDFYTKSRIFISKNGNIKTANI